MIGTVLKENRWFFIFFALFLIAGIMVLSTMRDGQELVWLAQRRTVFLDQLFLGVTRMGEEYVYLFLFLVFLFYKYRYSILIVITGLMVSLVSFLSKILFAQLRPRAFFDQFGLFDQVPVIEGIYINAGANSFPSGHTLSAFALYGFLAFLLPRKAFFGITMALLAIAVGFSRMYLFQHFMKDVFLGSILGVMVAMVVYWLETKRLKDSGKWDNSLLDLFFRPPAAT